MYVVTEGEKRKWKRVEREKYPKALVFHDGRLAMRPTLVNSIAMLMWAPYALILSILRIFIAVSLPYSVSTPILSFTGLRLTASTPNGFSYNNNNKSNGHLYVSNHRTLLDPLYVSFALKKNLIAVTYSLSRMSEILAPIKTVRLTRDRSKDGEMMNKLLKQGDLAVCPEGTTCREPYLLRFSPLFSEMCDEITPVAVDCHVSMFHGTTAGGLKCLDPVFFLMNPSPSYYVRFLRQVSRPRHHHYDDEAASRFEVANRVQTQIADALGFQCTKLTRKDKYLMLAGNNGLVVSGTSTTNANHKS